MLIDSGYFGQNFFYGPLKINYKQKWNNLACMKYWQFFFLTCIDYFSKNLFFRLNYGNEFFSAKTRNYF